MSSDTDGITASISTYLDYRMSLSSINATSALNEFTSTNLSNFTTLNLSASSPTNGSDRASIYVTEGSILEALNKALLTQRLLPSLVYVCLLLLLGIPGNLLVIYVYLLKWNKSTSRIFILSLGFYDLTNCLCSLTTEVALLVHFLDFDYPVFCKVSRFITSTNNNGSTFILVAIAIDRFKRICRVYDEQIGTTRAKWIALFSVIFALFTSWPVLVLYGTQTIPIPLKSSVIVIGRTCLIEDQMVMTYYPLAFVLFLICGHFIVDFILIILYSCVGKAICHQRHLRKSMRQHKCVTSSNSQPEISQASVTMEDMDENQDSMKKKAKSHRPISFLQFRNSFKNGDGQSGKKEKKVRRNLVLELKKSIRSKASNSSTQSDANDGRKIHAGKTTLMLFLVTLGFILSFLPYSIIVVLRYSDRTFYANMSDAGKSTYQLFLRSYLLNSVINPVVYCFVSKQFRLKSKEGVKSFCRK